MGSKLVIQIPCLNEAKTLPLTIAQIPRVIAGVDSIEIIVIDDGSSDATVEIARSLRVTRIIPMKNHGGLARAFMRGIRVALDLGADVIVNLDADNQYSADQIPSLIAPILSGDADIVLGARDFDSIPHFSPIKRWFQRLGSRVLSRLCRGNIPDAATGFRAFSRSSAQKLNVFTKYTYTLETLIQASHLGEKVVSVPVKTNAPTRPSRLFSHPISYVIRSAGAVIRLIVIYNPLRFFSWWALMAVVASLVCLWCSRQSWGLFFAGSGVSLFLTGLVLDQISVNRRILEGLRQRIEDVSERLK